MWNLVHCGVVFFSQSISIYPLFVFRFKGNPAVFVGNDVLFALSLELECFQMMLIQFVESFWFLSDTMVYSLLVITARNWAAKESIQDLQIFFRRECGFVQQFSLADSDPSRLRNAFASSDVPIIMLQWNEADGNSSFGFEKD